MMQLKIGRFSQSWRWRYFPKRSLRKSEKRLIYAVLLQLISKSLRSSRKMHLHLFHKRRVDGKGRVYIAADEMTEIYRSFHAALNKTYWDTASNHKVCTEAMEILKTTHISTKNGRFLMIFTSIISEVYRHDHYNVQELMHDDWDSYRSCYWSDILSYYKVIMSKADRAHFHNKCYQTLALLLHFATLYSLYKDVAEEDFITSVYQRAQNYILRDRCRQSEPEAEQIREYYEAIETIYRLRSERQQRRNEATSHEADEAPTLKLTEGDVVDDIASDAQSGDIPLSKEELYTIYDKALIKHKAVLMRKQEVDGEEALEELDEVSVCGGELQNLVGPVDDRQDRISRKTPLIMTTHLKVSETELENAIKNLSSPTSSRSNSFESNQQCYDKVVEEKSTLVGSPVPISTERRATVTCASTTDNAVKSPETLENFDFKEEFERRFSQKKKTSSPVKLPIIGKQTRNNIVHSYRRKALFDDVEFRKPITVPQISSHNASDDATVTTATDLREIKPHDEVHTNGKLMNEPNNNTMSPNSYITDNIIEAGLPDKTVSSMESNRRASMII